MPINRMNLTLSVHDLVDFLLRKGDIDNRVYNQETMQLGTKIHASFQKKQGNDYLSEVSLKETFERPLGTITLEGRADGVIVGGPFPIIDEIKSTVLPLDVFYAQQQEWHEAQALCYALMYAHMNKHRKMGVRLTYISQIDNSKKKHEKALSIEEIERHVFELMDRYLEFWKGEYGHVAERNEKSKTLVFPFDSFRNGQREMAKYIYSVATKGGDLFVEAPTGIGKTISALYPSIKSFSSGKIDKIFYLTAKNSGSLSASDTLGKLYENGYDGRDSVLTSKEKICPNPGASCNPDNCIFARGYYDHIKEAIDEAIRSGKRFSRDYVLELALEKQMCPFELSLDLSLFADVIICDYNYFFDPLVKLERYFGDEADPSRYMVLVDEAHNLVERGRDMYGGTLSLDMCASAKKALGANVGKSLKLSINKIEKALKSIKESSLNDQDSYVDVPEILIKALTSFNQKQRNLDKEQHPPYPPEYKNFSRECYAFLTIYNNYSKYLTFYSEKHGSDFKFIMYCLDPSPLLGDSLSKVRGRVLFSATLSPIDYYMNAIEGDDKKPYILLPSPFPPENLKLIVAPNVSTRFKDRGKSYDEVARYLESFFSSKKGNYFIFFPSYEYLDNIIDRIDFKDAKVYVQDRSMTEIDKENVLSRFKAKPKKTHIGLFIMGGSFSEGIDLVDDRLIGVAIVGVGLPTISYERDLIREYYEKRNGKGFDYAYKNQGLNKVMQAMGRLIRSESDKGAVLLIDDRYLQKEYRSILERSYSGYEVAFSSKEIKETLDAFFLNSKK